MNIIPRRQIPQGANLYRVVLTVNYTSGPMTVPSAPTTKQQAVQQWRARVASGLFTAHSGRSVRVMSVDECRKAGIR